MEPVRIRRPAGLGLWGTLLALVLLSGCAVQRPADGAAPVTSPPATIASAPARPTAATPSTTVPATSTPTPTRTGSATPAACPKPASGFVTHAPGTGKTVALTFDDGPGPADRDYVGILDHYGIHATFFETGAHAKASPDIVRLLAAHGELIADHSWSHDYPTQVSGGWSRAYLRDQFRRTNAELAALTGRPVCFVRPPGGFRTNVLAAASGLRMTATLWSVDSEDWKQPPRTTAVATNRIVANATAVDGQAHPTVLMHSTKASHEPESLVSSYRGNTVVALPRVIEWYRSHGYRFVTLDGAA